MRIKTFIINLKDSEYRKKQVLEETSKFPFMDIELIEAVDGRSMSEKEIRRQFDVEKFFKSYQRFPAKGEIGCTLSHRLCYERLLASNEPYALILEDDVLFPSTEEVEYVIGEAARLLQEPRTDLILLTPDVVHYNFPRKINDKYTAYPIQNAYATYAYLINRKGAECLLKNKYPNMVADDYPLIQRMGVKVKCIYPFIAETSTLESTIHNERETQRTLLSKSSFFYSVRMRIKFMYVSLLSRCGILVRRGIFS